MMKSITSRMNSVTRTLGLCLLTLPLWSCAEPEASPSESGPAHTNRLIDESSPYLQQHAHNPVDWFPWGDAAFEKARREDKPIFLSVGYSTCYWCHVMEKESFEDEEVAKILNEHYVAIKVDREERPDVDKHYMLATQLLTGRGGWPNSVWLTPEGEPWMAGTYFPKPRFMAALNELAEVWEDRRDAVDRQARQIAARMEQVGGLPSGGAVEPSMQVVAEAADQIEARFDEDNAGFGPAPKFPPHGTLRLLLALSESEDAAAVPESVTRTLDAMWLGGMRDHVGGGFHRYSTDAEWLLPHFEKMLYDNAQLMLNYAAAAAATGEPRYRRAVADIYRWLQREMTDPAGGFYSAIDSGEVGEEGAFYLWTMAELEEVLEPDDAELFADSYGFEKRGNFEEESTGKRTGENIPHMDAPIASVAEAYDRDPEILRKQLAAMRARLLEVRQERPFPHKDDKVLTSWNGLMIEALAYAGRVLDEPEYTRAAENAADFILNTMWTGDGLLRSYRGGKAHQPAFLDDHAYLAAGLLELYAATGEERWLRAARRIGDVLLAEFNDPEEGGFYLARESESTPFARSKALQGGGNIPDPNGTAARVLLALGERTGDARYTEAAAETLQAFAGLASGNLFAKESVLLAMLRAERPANNSDQSGGSGTQAIDTDEPPEPDGAVADNATSEREGPVALRLSTPKSTYAPGDEIPVRLRLTIDEGWHLYGENPELDFLVPVQLQPVRMPRFEIGEVKAPKTKEKQDPILKETVHSFEGEIEYTLPYRVREDAKSAPALIAIKVTIQACDATRCLPPRTVNLRLPVEIAQPNS